MSRYFGTDGIRGRAGEGKLSEASLLKMAQAIGAHFGAGSRAVIGRDTRQSGPALEAALTKGLNQQGVDVVSVGVMPTPATAFAVSHLSADFGLMITASHNPWHDNGVKLFGPDGRKISDSAQDRIETLIATALTEGLSAVPKPGDRERIKDVSDAYVKTLTQAYIQSGAPTLNGLSIVVDCANGAAFETLPAALRALGAEPRLIGVSPDGQNINQDCGSTHTEALKRAVLDEKASLGVALDGDADRLILVNDQGETVDGDQIMARLATDWQAQGRLKGGAVVSTVMSNLGFEAYLSELDLKLERTAVGDRHVAQRMGETGCNLGGEPSGHLLMPDLSSTGDGSLAALMILAGFAQSGQTSSAYLHLFDPYPQRLKNVRYEGVSPLTSDTVQAAIQNVDKGLGRTGRVLVRASGTEPVIRVMAEGRDAAVVSAAVEELVAVIASNAE